MQCCCAAGQPLGHHSTRGACRGGAGAACKAASALAGAPALLRFHARATAGTRRGQPARLNQHRRTCWATERRTCCELQVQLRVTLHPAPGLTRPPGTVSFTRALCCTPVHERTLALDRRPISPPITDIPLRRVTTGKELTATVCSPALSNSPLLRLRACFELTLRCILAVPTCSVHFRENVLQLT